MTRTPAEVSADIIDTLHVIDPGLSAAIGTPERKIIDAVASVVSASYIQSQIAASIWDVDTKTGVELDEICGLFGFGRREGVRATGTLSIRLNSAATGDYVIAAGTQFSTVASSTRASVAYQALSPVVIISGSQYAEVQIECSEVGVVGNTPAQTVTQASGFSQVATVYNNAPISGGLDAETDEGLRSRFKATFLRNLTGTEDFYAALCEQHSAVSKVRIIGPVERNTEQLQVKPDSKDGSTLTATSGISWSKFAWPRGVIVSRDRGTSDEVYFVEGQSFSADVTGPKIVIKAPLSTEQTAINDGDVLTVEHEYVSTASRNNPLSYVTNCVDLYVNGSEATPAEETTLVNMIDISSDAIYKAKTFTDDYGTTRTNGFLQLLGYGPVISVPATLQIGGKEYKAASYADGVLTENDYILVRQTGELYGSTRAAYGILFTGSAKPDNGLTLNITYSYNRVPIILDEVMRVSKQITTDTLVHESQSVPVGLSMVVQLAQGYSLSDVRSAIQDKLTAYFASLGFGAWIQFSDLHAVVREVAGVDNARMRKASDGTGDYGMRVYSRNGEKIVSTATADFRLADSQLSAFQEVDLDIRADNTFGE